jgi:hypothetical protein
MKEGPIFLQDGGSPEYMYHDRKAWRCELCKKYGSKEYPQRNAAHMVDHDTLQILTTKSMYRSLSA